MNFRGGGGEGRKGRGKEAEIRSRRKEIRGEGRVKG